MEDTEFDALLAGVETLGTLADAHDHAGHDDCDEHTPCWEHRYHTVAILMMRLGLDVTDIGFIADKLIEIQCEAGDPPVDDDVLDAKELL